MLYVKFGYDEPDDNEVLSPDGPGYIIIGDNPENSPPEQWARAELWNLASDIHSLLRDLNRFVFDERCKNCVWEEKHRHINIALERRKNAMFGVRIEPRTKWIAVALPQEEVLNAFKHAFEKYVIDEYKTAGGENYEYNSEFQESLQMFLQIVS